MDDDDDQPQQDSQAERAQRRELRHKYHQKKIEIQEQRETLTADISQLNNKLNEVNELFSEVTNTREAALDSDVIRMVSAIGTQKAKDLNIQLKSFQPIEFAEKAVTFMKGSHRTPGVVPAHGWRLLSDEAVRFFVKPPTFRFMHGSFERGEIPKKERNVRKHEKEVVTKAITPEEIPDVDRERSEQATEKEVERIFGILTWQCKVKQTKECNQKYKPICYFEFVTNPNSFGLTIENIFHVSFLIKDGYAKIDKDEDNLPTIEPVSKTQAGKNERQKNKQFIMGLNMQEWEEIKRVFHITHPLIPPRVRRN